MWGKTALGTSQVETQAAGAVASNPFGGSDEENFNDHSQVLLVTESIKFKFVETG